MNDLNLRVSGRIGEKVKKPLAPISLPHWQSKNPGGANDEFYQKSLGCTSADDQLKLLKQFLNNGVGLGNEEIVEFLVLLFWDADNKHPVKAFLKKHITDSKTLRDPFTRVLTTVIAKNIKYSAKWTYKDYIGVVTRLDACIDKFTSGADAVSHLEVDVTTFLIQCLEACIKALNCADANNAKQKSDLLSPTEISKIYDLVHLTLRLLLYMIQKVTDFNSNTLKSMFEKIKAITAKLMTGGEVPMDTKSVCGIVDLTMHLFENGADSWVQLLEFDRSKRELGTKELSVSSAVATVIPAQQLIAAKVNDRPAVLDLTEIILEIGDRYSSEPSHILAVARTVLAISKIVSTNPGLGLLVNQLMGFCWGHVEHHMDSVRHLAAQAMGLLVRVCVALDKDGDPRSLELALARLDALDAAGKGYHVALAALAGALGVALTERRPRLLAGALAALRAQPAQAAATSLLETLLKKHMQVATVECMYHQWIAVILEQVRSETDPSVLAILERIICTVVLWNEDILQYILPEQRALNTYERSDLKCVLLVLGVVRKSGLAYKGFAFEDLMHTAYDADDEVRLLALSLAATTSRSTEALSAGELRFVLYFLEYNVNAQAPNFRQLMLTNLKKILKRLEDSFKVLKRNQQDYQVADYLRFLEDLRELCFRSLAPGANYGRRCSVLQLLAWEQTLQLEGYERTWSEERAEILYNALEDSYENNKSLALDVLLNCPLEYLKKVSGSGSGSSERLLWQAASPRPPDCVAASYKLLLMLHQRDRAQARDQSMPARARFSLLRRVLGALQAQVAQAQAQDAASARDAPMYGLVHCARRILDRLDARAIAGNLEWSSLFAEYTRVCASVNSLAARVVAAAGPEGLLPWEAAGSEGDDETRSMTAQMVLLCAWRSVKETSLLLGSMVARLCIEGEDPEWTLSADQVEEIGDQLIELLSKVKHRGAFEQAYVGFTMLLARVWKCGSPRLHQLPLAWFARAERQLLRAPAAAGAGSDAGAGAGACQDDGAARRAAGLPFMIQALVTTELAVESSAPRGRLLACCVALCLAVARAPPAPAAAARAHLVLRALFRHLAPPALATADALQVAIRGFGADTWMERNSATLLFSALSVRVFGVLRARARLHPRNTMTGRLFFLAYPALYDFMLEQLNTATTETTLQPSLFPTLLLLARLYPSALEGTVSNLKLERFVAPAQALAGAADARTRRLAARAAAPLLPPHRYVPHIVSLLTSLSDPTIKKNLCHGILCQVSALLALEAGWGAGAGAARALREAAGGALWVLRGRCFPLADQLLHVLNALAFRFPGFISEQILTVTSCLEIALFESDPPAIASGREVFLANAVYMCLIILTATSKEEEIINFVLRCLAHPDYEVNLSALNYLLLLHDETDEFCPFLEHLSKISDSKIISKMELNDGYVKSLCDVARTHYLECTQKALKVLVYTPNTQKDIVKLKLNTDEDLSYERIMMELLDCVENGHENLSAVYLKSVLSLMDKALDKDRVLLAVVRTMLRCCSAGNDERSREAVVVFLEDYFEKLLRLRELWYEDESETFEVSATVAATAAILLEDDAAALRARAAAAVGAAMRDAALGAGALAARAGAGLRARARRGGHVALLVALAALDFRAQAAPPDHVHLDAECRVFDHSESHNVFLEEFTWTIDCAVKIKEIYCEYKSKISYNKTVEEFVASFVLPQKYRKTIEKLCIENAVQCLTLQAKSANPKIDLFFKALQQ